MKNQPQIQIGEVPNDRLTALDDSTDYLLKRSLFDDVLALHFLFLALVHHVRFFVGLFTDADVVFERLHILFGLVEEHKGVFEFEVIKQSFVLKVGYAFFLMIFY